MKWIALLVLCVGLVSPTPLQPQTPEPCGEFDDGLIYGRWIFLQQCNPRECYTTSGPFADELIFSADCTVVAVDNEEPRDPVPYEVLGYDELGHRQLRIGGELYWGGVVYGLESHLTLSVPNLETWSTYERATSVGTTAMSWSVLKARFASDH